jgi:hypothetical protein
LPFGSSRFLQIQKYLLEKNQLNKTSWSDVQFIKY